MVVAVIMGSCGGYFLGCCGFFILFLKGAVGGCGFVSVVAVGVVAAVVVGGHCCGSGGGVVGV